MKVEVFPEISCNQVNHDGQHICGDKFLVKTLSAGRRTVAVLSDGMGHGVKANILSTFTSTILLNTDPGSTDLARAAKTVLDMLPVCSVRKVSYSTFTLIDVDHTTGEVTIAEHDNPETIWLREGVSRDIPWQKQDISDSHGRVRTLRTCHITVLPGDRLVSMSDGVSQSGQSTSMYRFGWGREAVLQYAGSLVNMNPTITSSDLASQVVSRAVLNDGGRPSDDTSCMSIRFREPRTMLLVSCPPSVKSLNPGLVKQFSQWEGTRVICGYPVARIIADGLDVELKRVDSETDPHKVPLYAIPSVELVTEGLVIPNHVLDMLENPASDKGPQGVASKLYRMLIAHDRINMIIGLRRNIDASNDLPDEFELRRATLRQLINVLKTRYGKQVEVEYI